MSRRVKYGLLAGCSLLALSWWLSREGGVKAGRGAVATQAAPAAVPAIPARGTTGPKTIAITPSAVGREPVSGAVRSRERLSNTGAGIGALLRNEHALLLDNAWIDTRQPLNLDIPDPLKAPAGNDAYIIQARGVIGDGFRSLLSAAGAETESYIPNNAYLVRVNPAGLAQLQGSALVQSVLPYEPYYKLEASLLNVALTQPDLPPDVSLRVGVYDSALNQVLGALNSLGAEVVGQEAGPFGPVLRVHPGADHFLAIAQLPGVMVLEPERARRPANDLLRVRLGDSPNTVTNTNYLGLSGSNVVINLNDSGVDMNHPDLSGRLSGDVPASLTDHNGHGTHVAGTILGSGLESATVGTNASGSVSNASYRGLATNAQAFVIGMGFDTRMGAIGAGPPSDAYVQQTAAAHTNVFISNNSWDYGGSAGYDLAAASYDWAVRDALPGVTGPQPLLMVFAAGNGGGGSDDGTGGNADTISSPGAAKNVITVGALEQDRNITNQVTANGTTNAVWQGETDSSNEVAAFSSRGNVGVGIEGPAGRFKPDVVAPGVFVVSAKSSTWDQGAYFNPTNATVNTLFQQTVATNQLLAFSLFVPTNTVGVTLSLETNGFSPSPFPTNLLIYGRWGDNPTSNVFDLVTSNNAVNLPADGILIPGATLFFSVFNNTNELVDFDLQTVVVTTNDDGNLLTVSSNLNAGLGPYYRYETGTSMAAAGVSGELALMQEFLEGRLGVTNHSPALLKAMLINGSRTVSGLYDLQVAAAANSQGWGLPALANSIPAVLTNTGTNLPVRLFDENGTNALATGQARTWRVSLTGAGRAQPLRFTLVWTDPPGNPAAAVKLVNDLDLIVTNLDTGDVYWGNDIPAQSDYNETFGTNGPPQNDVVNNVENVYLQPPQGTNWSVTVSAHRVNVNTVTGNTNNVVQDYALVMGLGDGGSVSNGLTVTDLGTVSSNQVSGLITITNGVPLLHQRVGANSQYAGTTNGVTNQWNFYVFTNTLAATNAAYTNVAFVTFAPPELGVARMGVLASATEATRAEADIDLYVTQDPTLTNLNPAAINAAVQAGTASVGRTGTEKVLLGNSTANAVYYVGVKSEDQEGGEYGLVGVALTNSFNQMSNGNVVLTLLTAMPAVIPPGTPASPGSVTVLAVTAAQVQARKVVVIDTITHQEFGDLVGGFSHGAKTVVLNNHSFFTNLSDPAETFTYDDSGENDTNFPNARMSDGPGSLKSFAGDMAGDGVWLLTMVNDSSASDLGSIDGLAGIIVPHTVTNGFAGSVGADSWHYEFVDVPADATNLTITVGVSGGVSVDLYVRRGQFPDQQDFDERELGITPPGTNFNLNIYDSPPLNPGRYFIGIFNPNAVPASVNVTWTLGYSLAAAQPLVVSSVGNEPLLDDAVTYSTVTVGSASRVVSAAVGVRIDHPRESDLVLTLIDPAGTRVVLAENRGGLDTNGYGAGTDVTNVFPETTSGTQLAETNTLGTPTNMGTLVINYQFYTVPDDLRIYYDGARIFDSGLISGAGTLDVNFGPGSSTNLVIVMNEPGTNPATNGGDLWEYTASVVTKLTRYAVFTEDTNETTLPIKFAVPPFGAAAAFTPAVTNVISTFDAAAPGDYTNMVDGWTVLDTNPVKVVTVSALADTPPNVLALHYGSIQRTLPTVAGRSYTLTFVNHGRPNDNPISWWKGEGDATDSAPGNNPGTMVGGATFAPGLVGKAFQLDGVTGHVMVPDSPNLRFTTSMTAEAWVNPTNAGINQSVIEKFDAVTSVGQSAYSFALAASGPAYLLVNETGNDFTVTPSAEGFSSIPANQWTHIAGTYDGIALRLYVNGVLQATTPYTGNIFPGTDPLGLGANLGGENATLSTPGGLPAPYAGLMDEPTVYSNALSIVQIQDIYAAGSAGKCTNIGSTCPVEATVGLSNVTNLTIVGLDGWTTNAITFTAPADGTVLTINPLANGMLLDSFVLVQNPIPNPGNYYLPEESLAKLTGDNAQGNWQLEVLDNRAGATNPTPTLVSWYLSLVLDRVVPVAIPLVHAVPNTNMVAPNFFAYYSVEVPLWAQFATNLLVTASGPVQIWFNQNQEPNGTNAGDLLITNGVAPGGFALLSSSSLPGTLPPLAQGKTYYLGVQNLGAAAVNFTIEVDFDITTLTNRVLVTNLLAADGVPRYYQYDVSSNAAAVEFELFQKTGNVGLVARKGAPLPDLTHWDYASLGNGTNSDAIVVATNSTPVALTPGRWYLGVFNQDVGLVNYTIEAVESGPPLIIVLTNDEQFTTNVPPGPDLGLFFELDIPNTWTNTKALFELVNLNGNVDLTLQTNRLPYAAPFFASSGNPGTNNEQIVIRTNTVLTNLVASWLIGVPNNATSNVTFTVHAVVDTNGMLVSALPLNPVPTLPVNPVTGGLTLTWPTVVGETYEVEYSTNLVTWTLIPPPIVATGTTTVFTDPTPILSGGPARFYQIVQLPGP